MKILKEYGIITIGVILVLISLEFFFFPNKIASGGVSGLALAMNNIFKIDTGIVMIICNAILFVLAFVFIGGNFGIKSMYAAFGLSVALSITEKIYTPIAFLLKFYLAGVFGISAIPAVGTILYVFIVIYTLHVSKKSLLKK